MTARERGELLLIAATTGASTALPGILPGKLPLGDIVLYASILLLAQGLIRDLWIKYVARIVPQAPQNKQPLRCMCMESTVGVLGVVSGLGLIFATRGATWPLPVWFWPIMIGSVCLAGFLIKDLVLDFKAWTVRREKDHQNIVFW